MRLMRFSQAMTTRLRSSNASKVYIDVVSLILLAIMSAKGPRRNAHCCGPHRMLLWYCRNTATEVLTHRYGGLLRKDLQTLYSSCYGGLLQKGLQTATELLRILYSSCYGASIELLQRLATEGLQSLYGKLLRSLYGGATEDCYRRTYGVGYREPYEGLQ